MLKVEYSLSADDASKAYQYILKNSGFGRRKKFINQLWGAIIVFVLLFGGIVWLHNDFIGGAITGGIASVVVWFIIPLGLQFEYNRNITNIVKGSGLSPNKLTTLTIVDKGNLVEFLAMV